MGPIGSYVSPMLDHQGLTIFERFRIRRYGLVQVDVALLEECVTEL